MKKTWLACALTAFLLLLPVQAGAQTVTNNPSAYPDEAAARLIPVDVGNQNSYSGGGGSSGSSYSGGGYSSHDSGYSGGSSGGSSVFGIVVIVIVVVLIANSNKSRRRRAQQPWNVPSGAPVYQPLGNPAEEIAKTDPNFSESKFLSWVGGVFMTLNQAWTERNAEMFRPFESPELFLEHSRQIDEYIKMGRINYMQQIGIKESRLARFYTDHEHEHLEVTLIATLIDYVMEEKSGNIISGDTHTLWKMEYTMQFMRTKGSVTPDNPGEATTAHCPNCGAPVDITASGICPYCRSEISSSRYNWVLNQYKGRNIGSY